MATSCDGNLMGRVYAQPARQHHGRVPRYFDAPAPSTWAEYREHVERGHTHVGDLSVESTCRCLLAAGHFGDSITGGMNEHGVSLGIEYMGMRPELMSNLGTVSTCSSHWTSSLIANGLLRAASARDAIRLMGALAEEHGFTYYWAPQAGCAIPVVDGSEAWMMEIFGPGPEWTPGCGRPGAVWCAQRVPDGEVTCNANRSRIGAVDLSRADDFMASPNLHALAEELGLWRSGDDFVWHEVYGVPGGRGNLLREWAVLNAMAPSRGLQVSGDPGRDRYPFSVVPDEAVDVEALAALMRDGYEGTPFDVTEHPVFQLADRKSPLARPFGSRDLFDLLGIEPERCVGSEASGYVYISQVRDGLPAPIAGCMWFTLGPSYTSCLAPIYAGVTEVPTSWSGIPDFTRIDRQQVQWKFQLVEDLTCLRYQEAIADVRAVFQPAEARFRALQPDVEAGARRVGERHGEEVARRFVTDYCRACMERIDVAYGELVDVLMFRHLYSYPEAAPPSLPRIGEPKIPAMEGA